MTSPNHQRIASRAIFVFKSIKLRLEDFTRKDSLSFCEKSEKMLWTTNGSLCIILLTVPTVYNETQVKWNQKFRKLYPGKWMPMTINLCSFLKKIIIIIIFNQWKTYGNKTGKGPVQDMVKKGNYEYCIILYAILN